MAEIRTKRRGIACTLVCLSLALATGAAPALGQSPDDSTTSQITWQVDLEQSLFAVVTHKEGLASGLAHEHLVVATTPTIELVHDPNNLRASKATFIARTEDLVIDDPEHNKRWQDTLLELGVLAQPLKELKDKDRRKIRGSMLGPEQLNAEQHSTLRAWMDQLEVAGSQATARLVLEVAGEQVEQALQFEWPATSPDGTLTINATASLRFSEFGIKPYSALLGAIRVADEFDVVIRVVAFAR